LTNEFIENNNSSKNLDLVLERVEEIFAIFSYVEGFFNLETETLLLALIVSGVQKAEQKSE
jgi:hypothetical protein